MSILITDLHKSQPVSTFPRWVEYGMMNAAQLPADARPGEPALRLRRVILSR